MKVFTGKVVAKLADNTAKVAVDRVVSHPVYKKRYKKMRHFLVHDELNSSIGQTVKFAASKPYSKLVKWKMLEIVADKSSKKSSDTKKKEKK